MLRIIKTIILITIVSGFGLVLVQSVMAQGNARSDRYGLETATTEAGILADSADRNRPASTSIALGSGKILGAILAFLGIIFLILMISGGLMWMTAQGNDQQLTKAKNLLVAAVVGLIIVLSAYAITTYLGDNI